MYSKGSTYAYIVQNVAQSIQLPNEIRNRNHCIIANTGHILTGSHKETQYSPVSTGHFVHDKDETHSLMLQRFPSVLENQLRCCGRYEWVSIAHTSKHSMQWISSK